MVLLFFVADTVISIYQLGGSAVLTKVYQMLTSLVSLSGLPEHATLAEVRSRSRLDLNCWPVSRHMAHVTPDGHTTSGAALP